MEYELNNTLEQTRQLNLTGNIIPHSWYSKITFPSGSPDLLGTVLLAEIVYWYRPVEVKDERTGQLLGYRKKFAADMLQRSLSSFADQFGSTKRQVADALKRLEDAGLIIKKLRTIETAMGVINNVLFIAPVPSAITSLDQNVDHEDYSIEMTVPAAPVPSVVPPTTIERSRGYAETYEGVRSNVAGGTPERGTYTENTTKITTEITAAREIAAAAFSKKSETPVADTMIGETLTATQIKIIQDVVSELSGYLDVNPLRLSQEIEYVILSSTSFSNASRDFNKKLNTIKKMIKERRWTSPVGLTEKKEAVQKRKIDPIKRELNEAELDCQHWKKMVHLALEKGQKYEADSFRTFLEGAQEKIESIRKKFVLVMNNKAYEGV